MDKNNLPAQMDWAALDADGRKETYSQWQQILQAGVLPDTIKNPLQAMQLVETGRTIGLDPWEALNSLQIVKGRPCLRAPMLAGLLAKRYGDDAFTVTRSDAEVCEIKIKKTDPETGKPIFPVVRFTMEDAKRAGLSGPSWTKWPADMLFARAITRVEKRHLPLFKGREVWVEEAVVIEKPQTLGDI